MAPTNSGQGGNLASTQPLRSAGNMMGNHEDMRGATDRNYNRNAQTNQEQRKVIQTREAEVWVKKWVDYSTKYGLGYYLSNEATGVFFNDSTKIVLDPNGHHIDYMERRSSDRQDVGKEYSLVEYPKELQKKVTLLQHFWSYLEGNDKPKNLLEKNAQSEGAKVRKVKEVVYVKKWMRTRHAIMFRLSNKVVQVNF
jgi:polo-like kinase 1